MTQVINNLEMELTCNVEMKINAMIDQFLQALRELTLAKENKIEFKC